jgi:predicted dehydrogenase
MGNGRFSVAFIGAGFVNFGGGEGPWDHASRLELMSDVEAAGICDPIEDRARFQLERRRHGKRPDLYANCRIFADWEAMLDAVKPYAVIIGLPPGAHGRLSGPNAIEIGCAQRGVHMLVEKPLAVGEAAEVNALAQQLAGAKAKDGSPLVVSVGYMLRYSNMVQHLREVLVTAAADGRAPCIFTGSYSAAYPFILSPAFWDRRKSGGAIIEQATHFVDLARYLMGEIDLQSIVARQIGPDDPLGQLRRMPRDAQGQAIDAGLPKDARIARATVAQWRFTSGALGTLIHGLLQQGKAYDTELDIWADGLRAVLTDPYSDKCRLVVRDRDFRAEPRPLEGPNDPYYAELEAFLRAIRQGRHELIRSPYADAAKSFEVTCRITDSAA